jgi:hypothetical protein
MLCVRCVSLGIVIATAVFCVCMVMQAQKKNTHNLDSLKKNFLGSLRGFPGECFYLVFVLSPPPYSQVTGSLLDRFLLFYLSLYRNASETLTLRFSFFIISIFCVCVFFCSRGNEKKGCRGMT